VEARSEAIAIYRDGSKKVQPVNTSNKESNSKTAETIASGSSRSQTAAAPSRRHARLASSQVLDRRARGYITVGLFEDNTPASCRHYAKEVRPLRMMDAFATSVSLLFQYGVPLSHLVEKFRAHALRARRMDRQSRDRLREVDRRLRLPLVGNRFLSEPGARSWG